MVTPPTKLFRIALVKGKLEDAKRYLSILNKLHINPFQEKDIVFYDCLKTGKVFICIWLISLAPKYGINPFAGDIVSKLLLLKRRPSIRAFMWLLSLADSYWIDPSYIYSKAFGLAMTRGYLSLCRHIWTEYTIIITSDIILLSLEHIKIYRWITDELKYKGDRDELFCKALERGNLDLCKEFKPETPAQIKFLSRASTKEIFLWVMNFRDEDKLSSEEASELFKCSVINGFLSPCEYLSKNYTINYTESFKLAAEHGHLHICKWLMRFLIDPASKEALEASVRNGHLEVCKWLYKYVDEDDYKSKHLHLILLGAKRGHRKVTGWLCSIKDRYDLVFEKYYPFHLPLSEAGGDIETIKWLIDIELYTADCIAYLYVVSMDNSEILDILKESDKYDEDKVKAEVRETFEP